LTARIAVKNRFCVEYPAFYRNFLDILGGLHKLIKTTGEAPPLEEKHHIVLWRRTKMQTRTTFILILTIILTLAAGSAFGASYSGGSGTTGAPYQIANKDDLLALAANTADYGKCFILTADINMEGQVFAAAIIAPDTVAGGYFDGTAFAGTFDGNDHKVTDFTINGGSYGYIGLFGYINSSGSVKNLGLKNFSFSSSSSDVGGVAGENDGSISNCYSMGTVSGGPAGGLIGENWGSVSKCYSTSTVSGYNCVGGLVGEKNGYSNISNCYSTGAVSGYFAVGGLVGADDGGSISNCYAMGSVSGSSGSQWVGGLIGYNQGGSISNCYSTGAVSGSSYVGGLAGRIFYGGSILGSFWDTQTSGWTTSAGGTGKTTAEMKTLSTFTSAEWDFVAAWGMGNGQTYPYLKLFNRINPADLNYDGTVDMQDFAILAANWLSGE
jgi:hypothetical protein